MSNRFARDRARDLVYTESGVRGPQQGGVEVRLSAPSVSKRQTAGLIGWCRQQTLSALQVVVYDREGREISRIDRTGNCTLAQEARFFAAPGSIGGVGGESAVSHESPPSHLQSLALILAAEDIDAVALKHGPPNWPETLDFAAIFEGEARGYALFRCHSFDFEPATDRVTARPTARLAKVIDGRGVTREAEGEVAGSHRHLYRPRSRRLRGLTVGIADASRSIFDHRPSRSEADRPFLLVTTSFLARGGAEHTLFETLRALRAQFEPVIVTLAPHRPELDDRRPDFAQLGSRLFSFGDWVHPVVMVGMLSSLIRTLEIDILYNANGTTLFYEFAPRLRRRFPKLRIVDHLYDHRVGYIDRYHSRTLLDSIDACVAENHRIAEVLRTRGWDDERVPVIWPCGRRADEFPDSTERLSVRRRIRDQLGISPKSVVFVTAARAHSQKRPLDLVRVAKRVRDLEQVQFIWVGGGDLERELDEAIAKSAARIRRLPFRTDIPDLIVASDVGCLVSAYEGLPVFMIECFQAGLPFVGTDVGEMGEVLRRSGAGLVVGLPGDIDALEQAIRQAAESVFRDELATKAVEMGREFEVELCAERYASAWRGR